MQTPPIFFNAQKMCAFFDLKVTSDFKIVAEKAFSELGKA
jgi:hypothetical protein